MSDNDRKTGSLKDSISFSTIPPMLQHKFIEDLERYIYNKLASDYRSLGYNIETDVKRPLRNQINLMPKTMKIGHQVFDSERFHSPGVKQDFHDCPLL